jgi:tetratricopeptide (TPR) repeat protein
MPDKLIPFADVSSTIKDVLDQTKAQKAKIGTQKYIRLLQHAAAFAENQVVQCVVGTSSYSRDNGERINAWNVDVGVFCMIYNNLGYHDSSNTISYHQKSIAILECWIVQISLTKGDRIDILTEKEIECLYEILSSTETNLATRYEQVEDWDKAIHYQEQSILHAKQIKDGEDKIKTVYNLISRLGDIYNYIGKLTEAKAIKEEAYMYVSQSYDPEYPLVLEAGGKIIEILNRTRKFYDAERFA